MSDDDKKTERHFANDSATVSHLRRVFEKEDVLVKHMTTAHLNKPLGVSKPEAQTTPVEKPASSASSNNADKK